MTDVLRIGLVGGECTGKSALARALGALLPGCVVDEQLRHFVDEHGRPPRREEQWRIMAAQQRAEDEAAAACSHPWLIADPAPLMTAVYSVAYFDDSSLLADSVSLAAGYHRILWCDEDLPWEPDGDQRDGPEFRGRVHGIVRAVVNDLLVPRGVPVRLVTGPLQARLGQTGLAWQPERPKPPT